MPFSVAAVTPLRLQGLCFSPYLREDILHGQAVTSTRVTQLVNTVAPYVKWVRTFGAQDEWTAAPKAARAKGLSVAAGCDIYSDLAYNNGEAAALIRMVKSGRVDIAVVGDEVLEAEALSETQLIAYIKWVRSAGVKTATSDTWNQWVEHPKVMAQCDVVLVNIYPYWEGVPVKDAVGYLASCYQKVKRLAGSKPVIVETGWPTGGAASGRAVPNQQNAATYLRQFMTWAQANGVNYFYFEAFDENWKAQREGPSGACWGLWDTAARLKPCYSSVISRWR